MSADNTLFKVLASSTMEKSAGKGDLAKGLWGLGRLIVGTGARSVDDWMGSQWRWMARRLLDYKKKVRRIPNWGTGDVTRKSGYEYTGNSKFWKRVADVANSHAIDKWGKRQLSIGGRQLAEGFGKTNPQDIRRFGHRATRFARTAGQVGMGGYLADRVVLPMWEGYEDSWLNKGLKPINYANPAYWMFRGLEIPDTYATPLGWVGLGAGNLMEGVADGMVGAAQQGATQAINSTADALSSMSFADRLGMLFAPGAAANRYRATAMDQLARTMAAAGMQSTGDPLKDKALEDIIRTV